jgi:hypothetical protein
MRLDKLGYAVLVIGCVCGPFNHAPQTKLKAIPTTIYTDELNSMAATPKHHSSYS